MHASIDIFGSNEKRLVLGQVSYTDNPGIIEEKIESLKNAVIQAEQKKKAVKDAVKIYFGPEKAEDYVLQIDPHLIFISLEKVFEEMKGTGILRDMLGVDF